MEPILRAIYGLLFNQIRLPATDLHTWLTSCHAFLSGRDFLYLSVTIE